MDESRRGNWGLAHDLDDTPYLTGSCGEEGGGGGRADSYRGGGGGGGALSGWSWPCARAGRQIEEISEGTDWRV